MDSAAPAAIDTPPVATPATGEWRTLSPAAAAVRSIAGAITGTVLSIPVSALLLANVVNTVSLGLAVILVNTLTGATLGAWIGRMRWRRTRWKLDDIGLHVRRGLLWRTEVLVPRSRVQHLDIERGPLERQFTLATLVVHTAGTQTHALRQSGLDDADAVALRNALIPDAARHVDAL